MQTILVFLFGIYGTFKQAVITLLCVSLGVIVFIVFLLNCILMKQYNIRYHELRGVLNIKLYRFAEMEFKRFYNDMC